MRKMFMVRAVMRVKSKQRWRMVERRLRVANVAPRVHAKQRLRHAYPALPPPAISSLIVNRYLNYPRSHVQAYNFTRTITR